MFVSESLAEPKPLRAAIDAVARAVEAPCVRACLEDLDFDADGHDRIDTSAGRFVSAARGPGTPFFLWPAHRQRPLLSGGRGHDPKSGSLREMRKRGRSRKRDEQTSGGNDELGELTRCERMSLARHWHRWLDEARDIRKRL